MIALKELRQIGRQIQGKENMFGYRTTFANQVYLVYFILIDIYHSKKVHWSTKSVFLVLHYELVVMVACVLVGFTFFDTYKDISALLQILYVGSAGVWVACNPILASFFRDDIEKFIAHIDAVEEKKILNESKIQQHMNTQGAIMFVFYYNLFSILVYCFVNISNGVLFYSPDKMVDDRYYCVPMPRLDLYGSLPFFLIFQIFSMIALLLEMTILSEFFYLWAVSCHNEAVYLCDSIESQSRSICNESKFFHDDFDRKEMEDNFGKCLAENVRGTVGITRQVSYLLIYYEVVSSAVILAGVGCLIAHLFVFLYEGGFGSDVAVKELTMGIYTTITVYFYFKPGAIIDCIPENLTMEVYSTPWYLVSPKLRRTVCLFLCQSRQEITPVMWLVYPINGATFSSYINFIYSTASFLYNTMAHKK